MAAVAQIVTTVGSTGTVVLDLNALGSAGGVMIGKRDGIDLARTELARKDTDRPVVWSPSDPEGIGTRKITVPVVLLGASADDLAAKIRTLNQAVTAPFVLKVQRAGSSVPVWLRCWPTLPKLETGLVAAGRGTALATGVLEADTEPYAIGARVDVGPFTITQDPAVAGAWTCDVTGVTGDALTPAVIRLTGDEAVNVQDQVLVAVRRRGVPSSLTATVLTTQAEGGSTVTGGSYPPTVTTFTSDSTFSGSSGLRATYPSGTVSGTSDFSYLPSLGSLSGVEAAGTYRALLRVRRSGGAAGLAFTLKLKVGGGSNYALFTAGGADTRGIDLGLIQLPMSQPATMAAPEGPTAVSAPSLDIQVQKSWSGAGVLDVDWVALVPADQDAGLIAVTSPVPGSGRVLVLDGYDHLPRVFTTDPYTGSSPSAYGLGTATTGYVGGVPRLAPGSNRLWFVTGLGTVTVRAPSITFTANVSYWPRFGWLA